MTVPSDLLRAGQHFPLGAALGPRPGQHSSDQRSADQHSAEKPKADNTVPTTRHHRNTARPFGLRWARVPTAAAQVELDWSAISYDPDRQIALVNDEDGHVLPAMKHTSTQTTTSTSEHDRNPPDSDTDATGT